VPSSSDDMVALEDGTATLATIDADRPLPETAPVLEATPGAPAQANDRRRSLAA
jgi:hypothetical protein